MTWLNPGPTRKTHSSDAFVAPVRFVPYLKLIAKFRAIGS